MSLRTFIKHLPCKFLLLARYSSLHSLSSLSPQLPNPQDQDPYTLMKQDPIQICSEIWVKSFSTPKSKPFSNLTGFLSKFDIWVLAYQRSVAHFTGSFPSSNAISFQALQDLLSLRNAVVKGHFKWNMKENPFIRSRTEKKPISNRKFQKFLESDVQPFQDHVVQEVLLMILEPIFESKFSSKSHAFRPGRNAHTVIRTIRSNFAGFVWFMRGDFSGVLENVEKNLVMGCLENVVKDKRVLGLIDLALRKKPTNVGLKCCGDEKKGKKVGGKSRRKFLKPNEPKPDPYWLRTFFDFAPDEAAKVPCYGYCGILSPLLANVCLNELDCMMEEKINKFFRSSTSVNDGCHNPSWPEFVPSSSEKEETKKMDYIRYGGHVLVGVRGSREDVVELKKELISFCGSKLGITLESSKIEIEHVSRGIQFLDHVICRRVIYPTLHYTGTGGKIISRKGVGTLLSVTASLPQCIRRFRHLELLKGDTDPEPLPCTPMLYSSQAHTNAQMNKFLETMADWYRYADNRKKIVGFCAYVIRSSLAKLYAARYKLKSRAKVYSMASRDLSYPLRERRHNIASEYSDLLRLGLVDVIEGVQFSRMSLIPSCDYTPFPRAWVPEHEQVLIEYVKLQDPKFFSELLTSVKTEGLTLPQDEISETVWEFKILGVRQFETESRRDLNGMDGVLTSIYGANERINVRSDAASIAVKGGQFLSRI